MTARVVIRPDILANYGDLFGSKRVPSGAVVVEELIASLVSEITPELRQVLRARHERQSRVANAGGTFDFADSKRVVADPDDNQRTVLDIRQGMLDGFFGRPTAVAWRVGERVALPDEAMRPGLEGTGPCIDLGMAFAAINAGASSWMWDWEDAGGDYRDQLYRAWTNLKEILAGEWDHRVYTHPTKVEQDASGRPVPGKPRTYAITVPRKNWPVIFHRVPGLHLRNRQIALGGEDVPAIVPALVIHALNNYESQRAHGSSVYFYVPKLEHWREARIVGVLLRRLEEAMGIGRGSLKIKMLNERAEFLLQQELIQWVLRENLIGPNVGRWDYINSREDMFHHDAAMVIPNPSSVTMTEPSMTAYTRRNALMAMLAGAMPIGGMAAQMPNPRAPQHDAKALRDIWFDKLRERLTGLFLIDGRLHDTYRQSWVATVSPAYVGAGREPLVTSFNGLQAVVDKTTPDERARLESLGLLRDGKVSPLVLERDELTVEALFAPAARAVLLRRPDGPTTEDGLRYAMHMATEYVYQQLHGNNAAAIDDPNTGLRFMNDLATYEIFWHFLYLAVYHGVTLTDAGRFSAKGDKVTPALFMKLIDERRETVKKYFAKTGTDYASTDAEFVLDILRRQIVDRDASGAIVPQPRWIKYGSRVLLSLIECPRDERDAILDGVLADRSVLAQKAESAPTGAARDRARRVLSAHDYVYDLFEAPAPV